MSHGYPHNSTHGHEHDAEVTEDGDSAVGLGSSATSTMSLGANFAVYHLENGRTYHSYKPGKYMFPNDQQEMERLEIQHKMWEIQLDHMLHLAPLGNPQYVLDLCTGSGNWAIDFAHAYPSAVVIGTDLSPVQPEYVPPNCEFQIDDAEDPWVFTRSFDYIHARCCASCFRDPPSIIRKAYDALSPGGYLELQDLGVATAAEEDRRTEAEIAARNPGSRRRGHGFDYGGGDDADENNDYDSEEHDDDDDDDDGDVYCDSLVGTTIQEINEGIRGALAAAGRQYSWNVAARYCAWMEACGFEDVVETRFRWPCNSGWPTDPRERLLGALFLAQVDSGGLLESVCTRLYMTMLGYSHDRLVALLERAKRDLHDGRLRAYVPGYVVVGRKPLHEASSQPT